MNVNRQRAVDSIKEEQEYRHQLIKNRGILSTKLMGADEEYKQGIYKEIVNNENEIELALIRMWYRYYKADKRLNSLEIAEEIQSDLEHYRKQQMNNVEYKIT